MKKLTPLLLIILVSCSSESKFCGELENVNYIVNYYYKNMEKVDHIEYYDSNHKILRWWDTGIQINNYKYDKQGRLSEIHYSRSCQSIFKYEYKIYNDSGQLIGEYMSRTPVVNIDSIQILQTKFYNKFGELVTEISTENGLQLKTNYTYEKKRVKKKISLNEKGEIVKSQTYYYGNSGNIDSINIYNYGISTIEENKYDSQNRLIGKTIKSNTKFNFENPYIKPENVIFDNNNHYRTYEYKNNGRIKIERRLNKDGKSHLTIITEKKYAT
jgi:YD repeat-containing protein